MFGSSFLNTDMTLATFNSSRKDFVETHLLIQFLIGIKIYFLANLKMAGDISPLELLLMSISFMHLKIWSAEKNSNLMLKDFLNLYFIFLILGWLLKYLIFSEISKQVWGILPQLYIPNSSVILTK